MGLLLLIPGLIFLLNGTQWFAGENSVGTFLVVVGGLLLAIQLLWAVYVASKVKSTFDEVRRPSQRF